MLSLAQPTGEATNRIETTMLDEIRNETQASVTAMEATLPQIEHGLGLSEQSTDMLESIDTHAHDSLAKVRGVATDISAQLSDINNLVATMEDVSKMSDKTIEALQTNSEAVTSLNAVAASLKAEVTVFQVS